MTPPRLLAFLPLAALLGDPAAAVAPRTFRERPPVARVPVDPPSLESPAAEEAPPSRRSRRRCVDIDHVVGATMLGTRTIELTLDNGERYHMRFADDCPFLGFYGGFYYRRLDSGRLCAGRDSVIARSGAACTIEELVRFRPPPSE